VKIAGRTKDETRFAPRSIENLFKSHPSL